MTPPTVEMTLREYAIESTEKAEIKSGRVLFRALNAGFRDHELTLLPIPEDLPGSLNQQLQSPNRRASAPLVVLSARRPGEVAMFAADLPSGRYGLMCFLRDKDGQSHAVKGMNMEIRIR